MAVGAKKKFVIIDGKSVFYRGYYAMPNLSTKEGLPTGGVYGFAVMALEVIKRLKPDYVCVAWDKPKTNIRKRLEMYPAYKAGRKPPPPDFYEQIPLLHELLDAFGWPLYELDDYEADDIMGTLAVAAAKKDIETLLITSDQDVLQLVDPHIHAYLLKKGLSNIEEVSPATIEEKYGLRTDQLIDLKALKGDSSDNIPGVPGIGEKGAIDLLKTWGTLDNIYENLWQIKDALRLKLETGKESAYLSKELGSIWLDAPIELNLAELDGSKANPVLIHQLLQKFEFRNLARQLPEIMKLPASEIPAHDIVPNSYGKNVFIVGDSDLNKLKLNTTGPLYVHGRSGGKHGRDPQTLLISSDPSKQVYVLDLTKASHQAVADVLRKVIQDPQVPKIGYDIKSTIKILYTLGLSLNGVGHDVLIGTFLLNSLRREQTLTELAQVDTGYDGSPLEELSNEDFANRGAEIIGIISALHLQQAADLKELPKVEELARTIEWPIIQVLAAMEYEGIELDTDYLKVMSVEVGDMISDLEQQIFGHADTEFNIGSPAQLAEILFTKLDLPKQGIKKGKTGYSTAASELDKLRASHPIIDLITQWREVTKLKNTYIDTLPLMVDENSRLHTTFNLTIAQTGRLSSNDPNLQNIPVRSELGKRIRTAFVAGPGKMLISADYSQFELRLAAYLAGDDELMEMFNNGADVHTATAAQVYNRMPEEVTKQQRRDAKVINFGVLYGMSPHGLSIATGMTIVAAKAFIDRYFELRAPLLTYINSLKEKARTDGYVETLFGRRRPTPDIHSSNFIVRQAAERAAMNMPIQGTEADLMKMAMIQVQDKLAGTECKQLLQIHDSILIECPEHEADDMAEMLKTTMESVYKLPVKLTVDVTIGKTWGQL